MDTPRDDDLELEFIDLDDLSDDSELPAEQIEDSSETETKQASQSRPEVELKPEAEKNPGVETKTEIEYTRLAPSENVAEESFFVEELQDDEESSSGSLSEDITTEEEKEKVPFSERIAPVKNFALSIVDKIRGKKQEEPRVNLLEWDDNSEESAEQSDKPEEGAAQSDKKEQNATQTDTTIESARKIADAEVVELETLPEKSEEIAEPLSSAEERKRKREEETKRAYKMAAIFGGGLVCLLILWGVISGVSKNMHKSEPAEEAVVEEEQSAADQVNDAYEMERLKEEKEREQKGPTEDQLLDEKAKEFVQNMTLEDKVAGLFLVNIESLSDQKTVTSMDGVIEATLETTPVGGVLLSEDNMVDSEQFLQLVSLTRGSAKYEMFMGIIDEGGEDSPFIKKGLEEELIPSTKEIREEGGVAEAYSAGLAYGTRLRSYSLNLNFGPVADLTLTPGSVTERKSYGKKADDALSFVQNQMKGMIDGNIKSVVRYFPSYGDLKSDGSTSKAVSSRTRKQFDEVEGTMFKSLIRNGAQIIQASSVAMPEITGNDTPATLSPELLTDILRDELEFQGIIVSDKLSKRAITMSCDKDQIGVNAILAGCDMLYMPENYYEQYQAILKAVEEGKITEQRINESIYRIYRVKYYKQVEFGEIEDPSKDPEPVVLEDETDGKKSASVSDNEAEDDEDSKDAKDTKDTKVTKDAKDTKVTKDTKDAKEVKGSKGGEAAKGVKDAKGGEATKDAKDAKGGETTKDVKDAKAGEAAKDAKDAKGGKATKDAKDAKGGEAAKDAKDAKGGEATKDAKGTKTAKNAKGTKTAADAEEAEE